MKGPKTEAIDNYLKKKGYKIEFLKCQPYYQNNGRGFHVFRDECRVGVTTYDVKGYAYLSLKNVERFTTNGPCSLKTAVFASYRKKNKNGNKFKHIWLGSPEENEEVATIENYDKTVMKCQNILKSFSIKAEFFKEK